MHTIVDSVAAKMVNSESIGDRIRSLRGEMSIVNFSALFGMHRNTLRTYESGERFPDSRILAAICEYYKIHADWLLTGKGPKYLGKETAVQPAEIDQEILTDAIAALEEALQSRGRVMQPEAKAEIISEIYQLLAEEERQGTRANLAKILKLVA